MSSFFISKPRVLSVVKGFTDYEAERRNDTQMLIVTFDNNSVMLLDPRDGHTMSTIYPPPSLSPVKTIKYNMALKRMFVLLENGNLCVYRVRYRDTATLEKLQTIKALRDYEGHSILNQTIVLMTFVSVRPPQYDCEIFADVSKGQGKVP